MASDGEKTLNGTHEPFRRPVVWGKPPQTVFRAGPLPKGGQPAPLPEPLPPLSAGQQRVGPGILGGSMIPRAPARPAPRAEPVVARPSEPRAERVEQGQASPPIETDLTVRSLPLPEPLPVRQTGSPGPSALPAVRDAASSVARPGPTPDRAPERGPGRDKRPARAVLYGAVAVAVIAVLAVAGWMVTRSPAEAPLAAPPLPTAIAPAAPLPSVTAADTAAGEADAAAGVAPPPAPPVPVPVPAPRPAAPRPASGAAVALPASPAPARAVPPAPVQRAPAVAVPPVVVPPVVVPPVVVIVPAPPPPGPAPTAAERPSDDPDAPVATRPQPIG